MQVKRHMERYPIHKHTSGECGHPANAYDEHTGLLHRLKVFLRPRSRVKAFIGVARKTQLGRTIVVNLYWDLRYGADCARIKKTHYTHLGAANTQSTDFLQLTTLFKKNEIRIDPTDVLVDVGCGKGRVINFWLSLGCRNKIVGLELDDEVANETRRRLKNHANVTIIGGNAISNLPPDGTLFYLYNPFHAPLVHQFKERLWDMRGGMSGTRIVYYNSLHASLFKTDPRWLVEDLYTGQPDPAVLIRFRETRE